MEKSHIQRGPIYHLKKRNLGLAANHTDNCASLSQKKKKWLLPPLLQLEIYLSLNVLPLEWNLVITESKYFNINRAGV